MEYQISIVGLKRQNLPEFSNVVLHVSWIMKGTDEEGYEGTFAGATPIENITDLDSETFIPYEELQETDLINWITQIIDADVDYKNHIYNRIEEKIEEEKNLVQDDKESLPWIAPTIEEE